MQVLTDTKQRMPSSRVLEEVIHQVPAEYVTVGWLTSILHRHSFGIIILCLGLLSTTPIGSTIPGLVLAVMAVQLIMGRGEPAFPHFIMKRRLPTKQLVRLGEHAIYVLKCLEKAVHPRWPMPFGATKACRRRHGPIVDRRLAAHAAASEQRRACDGDLTDRSCLHRGRRTPAFGGLPWRDYINRHRLSGSVGNNCRRSVY
jgi:hypothetical protein